MNVSLKIILDYKELLKKGADYLLVIESTRGFKIYIPWD